MLQPSLHRALRGKAKNDVLPVLFSIIPGLQHGMRLFHTASGMRTRKPDPIPWWLVALGAFLLTAIYSGLVLSLPLAVAVVVGLGTFLIVLVLNPRLWMRRMAWSCLTTALAMAVTPSFDLALTTGSLALEIRDGGVQPVLAGVLALIGALLAVCEKRRCSQGTTPMVRVSGDFVVGEKHEHHHHGYVGLAAGAGLTQTRPVRTSALSMPFVFENSAKAPSSGARSRFWVWFGLACAVASLIGFVAWRYSRCRS